MALDPFINQYQRQKNFALIFEKKFSITLNIYKNITLHYD